jgi:hypothetical protein
MNSYPAGRGQVAFAIAPALRMKVAIERGDVVAVRAMLERGLHPDLDLSEMTHLAMPLNFAAYEQQPEICQLLLDHGANAKGRPDLGIIPLRTAAGSVKIAQQGNVVLRRRIATCQLLLEHGADPNEAGRGFLIETAMHAATKEQIGVDLIQLLQLLISHGGNPSHIPPEAPKNYLTPLQKELHSGDFRYVQFYLGECRQDPFQITVAGKRLIEICGHDKYLEKSQLIKESRLIWRSDTVALAVTDVMDASRATDDISAESRVDRAGMSPL